MAMGEKRALSGQEGDLISRMENTEEEQDADFVNAENESVPNCDGESQLNYEVFGDVIGFDATYSKNKFLCPFVIFSGVNNHNQTVIFATALVSDETEQKYVLLLEQFVDAMKGKAPVSVTTDGDLAMKNAIKSAFPYVHHRLCVWHLICNANSNVHILGFMKSFKKCMLGDFEVGKFENLWDEMVNEFGLHESRWIADMHNKRHMWATSYIKGSFFAGISTTSREGFHSHLGKFVSSKIGLFEFVEQFQRCLTYFRYRKFKADFDSDYESTGLPCDHIVSVLVHLDFVKFPKCLVLDRWSKSARKCIRERFKDGSMNWDSSLVARHVQLHFIFREVASLSYRDNDDYNHIVNLLIEELAKLRLTQGGNDDSEAVDNDAVNVLVEDPTVVRTKGCGPNLESLSRRSKRNIKCRNCGDHGHNKRSCVSASKNTQGDGTLNWGIHVITCKGCRKDIIDSSCK
ncbi:Protein FAR1-RELATED SEQUENCE 5 [Glycine max]|nr:Protein FAR1-RELATED SEQUENCE 5 [Glycine max]